MQNAHSIGAGQLFQVWGKFQPRFVVQCCDNHRLGPVMSKTLYWIFGADPCDAHPPIQQDFVQAT